MLTKLIVFNGTSEAFPLPLQDISAGYVVENIQGLDPVKATIVSTPIAQLDGSRRQASRRENRNILLQLSFVPELASSTVEALRRKLYGYLMPKTQVTLRFYIDTEAFVDIDGEVESCEAPLFSAEPAVNVSIICFDPDFYALAPSVVEGMTTATTGEAVFDYEGSTPAGFVFTLPVTRTLTGFTIRNILPNNQQLRLEVLDELLNGDTVVVNTIPGSKSIIRTRAGVEKSILYAVTPESIWPYFTPGENSVRVRASGTPDMPYSLSYIAKYGGL